MIGTGIDRSSWTLGAHLRVSGTDRFSLNLGYDREFGKHSQQNRVGLDLKLKF